MANAVLKTRSKPARKQRRDTTSIPAAPAKSRALPVHESVNQSSVARNDSPAAQWPAWYRSEAYELVNALTHGTGLVLSILGALLMGATAYTTGDPWRFAGCGVFVAAMMTVYGASTLSHSGFALRWRAFLRRVDQGVIYLLVVGTYTPFGLAYLRTGAGWLLLTALWTGAIVGMVSKIWFSHRLDSCLVWTYMVLGALPTITIPWLWNSVPAGTGPWMFAGGLFYLVGTIFLINDVRWRPFHAIWHVLVMAGSTCHFVAILWAVAHVA